MPAGERRGRDVGAVDSPLVARVGQHRLEHLAGHAGRPRAARPRTAATRGRPRASRQRSSAAADQGHLQRVAERDQPIGQLGHRGRCSPRKPWSADASTHAPRRDPYASTSRTANAAAQHAAPREQRSRSRGPCAPEASGADLRRPLQSPAAEPPSSRGLGRRPLTAETGVRIPVAVLTKALQMAGFRPLRSPARQSARQLDPGACALERPRMRHHAAR